MIDMKHRSILMPYSCQKAGWFILLALPVLAFIAYLYGVFIRQFSETYLHWCIGGLFILAYIALFLICLSREREEDEMISAIRYQTVTVMVYALFILLFCAGVFIGICLAINPDIDIPTETFGNVAIRFFLIAAVYEIIFKIRLWLNNKRKSE